MCALQRVDRLFLTAGHPEDSPPGRGRWGGGWDSLVVGRATGTQKVAASLLQVPVKHLQHFVALHPWPETQPKELFHLRSRG